MTGSLTLGASADTEPDGQPSNEADADGSDDDGVTVIASAVAVIDSQTTSSFSIVASEAAALDAWIDFNGDGDWDETGEQIVTSLALAAGVNTVNYSVPAGATPAKRAKP